MKTRSEYILLLREFYLSQAQKYGIKRMGLFGSVARNEHTPDSDIDIYIEGDSPSLLEMVELKEKLEKLLECKVDIIRLREKMNQYLRKRIEKDALYV